MFSVKEIQTRFNVSNQTARTDLEMLAKMGYLEEKKLDKKTKSYHKSENYDRLIEKIPTK